MTEGQQGHEPIGSAAEEAARLFSALAGWAQGHLSEVGSHLDTGAPECAYCPICRTVHLIREVSPEARDHLATATASLMQAFAGLLATTAVHQPSAGDRASTVERIDLDNLDMDWPDQ